MLFYLISAALLRQSFSQLPINCSGAWPDAAGYNTSYLMIVQNATSNGFPYPSSLYSSVFNNGTCVSYDQVVNGNPSQVDLGVTIGVNATNNPNFDCYSKVTSQIPTARTYCAGYSVILLQEPILWAIIGCYDFFSAECPTACTPGYMSSANHTFFAQFFLNNINQTFPPNIMDHSSAKTNTDDVGQSYCNMWMGYNTTTIAYDAFGVPSVSYTSQYSNGTAMMYDYRGKLYQSGQYVIVQSGSNNLHCNIIWTFRNITNAVQCYSFSIAMNGTAIVGCTSFNATCPTICTAEFVLEKGNSWFGSLALNRIG